VWEVNIIDKLAFWWLDWRHDRALKKLPGNIEWKTLHFDENGMSAEGISESVALIGAECSRMLEVNNAPNYFQFDIMPAHGVRPVRVTVQWASGESPAEQNARLRGDVEKLRAEIERLTERGT